MKRLLCCFFAGLFLLASLPIVASAADADVVLFSSAAPCTIIISETADTQDVNAAETLQRYLSEISGQEIPIASDSAAASGPEIAVGKTNRDSSSSSLPNGGYHIGFSGDTLCITGEGTKGTLNGVYAFLRDHCGCRWYAGDEIALPKRDILTVPADIDVTYKPFFEYAATDWLGSPGDDTFSKANGLTGNGCYISQFCHTLSRYFCARDEYFSEHPEYFALHDGKRSPNQLCLTNPDTIRIVTDEVFKYLGYYHDPNADLQIISLTQDDNGDYCECPSCKALDDANGSHAGSNISFANTVADAVKAAGYDNVAIDTFAYQYTRKTPTQVVPRENVIVRLCDIECCFCHTLDDAKCKENVSFMQDLRDWAKICKRVYIWDYTTDYFETPCIYPDFGVLQRNIQIFYENNVKGVFEEGNGADFINVEFAALRSYLLSRLMQDPYLDFDAEMRGFLDAYYGEAGKPIYNFLQRVTEKAGALKTSHLGVFPYCKEILRAFTTKDVAYCDEQWADALDKVADTRYFERTERSSVCWRYWKCSNAKGEFSPLRSTLYTRMREKETLYNDLVRMGVTRISDARRNRDLTSCRSIILLRKPGKWCALYENAFWDFLSPFVDKLYSHMSRIFR
ncbi:MAG: DUF4838 domain-containing protein [Clostridiales bacterium]|nr:DUF4838 domain-containing protein [Clostridiales bacterium]